MLFPSVETTSSSSLNRQKKNVAGSGSPTVKQTTSETSVKPKFQHPKINRLEEKSTQQAKPKDTIEALTETNFPSDGIHFNDSHNSYPDYTLELSSKDGTSAKNAGLRPDEIRFGRKRPPLPVTFSFGIPRSQAVAVAMRQPLLDGKQPTNAYQAILDTFDLAATNRLPYVKGTEINIRA